MSRKSAEVKHTPKRAPMHRRRVLKRRMRAITAAFWLGLFMRLVVVALILAVLLLKLMFIGPSQTVSNKLAISLTQTSALKFVPRLFLRAETLDMYIQASTVQASNTRVDATLINIDKTGRNDTAPDDANAQDASVAPETTPGEQAPAHTPAPSVGEVINGQPSAAPTPSQTPVATPAAPTITPAPAEQFNEHGVIIEKITGDTYKGHVMIVKDPSRVFVGVTDLSFSGAGMKLDYFAQKYDAIAGTNASGFEDEGGSGNGGTPLGLVVSEGVLLKGASSSPQCRVVAGFDENDILQIGDFSTAEAKALKLRDAAAWGPALIINGVPEKLGSGSTGLNPRTAIGQRADGAVIFVVIDGRHLNSLGATYADLIKVMLRYNAVNACNLDGGSSSVLYYNGERMSDVAPLTGSRGVPTAFLVRREE